MIFQGIFNILTLYLNEIEPFYNSIEIYFRKRVSEHFTATSISSENLKVDLNNLIEFISTDLVNLGFDENYVRNIFLDPSLEFKEKDIKSIFSINDLLEKKTLPLVYKIFLEKIVDYLIDVDVAPLMLKLKSEGFLNLEFIIELRTLKTLFDKETEKKRNLSKYIQIREKIIEKLSQNKSKIESLEYLSDPKEKLQILYLIYRIINFFHLERRFDFSQIKKYLNENLNEWLLTLPLVTLKNPDLYYCGLYLSKNLKLKLDKTKIKNFLNELYEEGTDEFEAPLVEATDGLYYYLKSTELVKIWLNDEQIDTLIKTDSKYFEPSYLKNLETSQLVVILKIFNMLKVSVDENKINRIINEIELRVTPEGIQQYRDGFMTSEATYYVLFYNYMRNSLEKLKDRDLLGAIVSRIYRNLEIVDFSAETNYDLFSELFYS
ncbi:MAG: hypothetical protein ACFFC9_09600, partial [Promethearchaeota archaeon]